MGINGPFFVATVELPEGSCCAGYILNHSYLMLFIHPRIYPWLSMYKIPHYIPMFAWYHLITPHECPEKSSVATGEAGRNAQGSQCGQGHPSNLGGGGAPRRGWRLFWMEVWRFHKWGIPSSWMINGRSYENDWKRIFWGYPHFTKALHYETFKCNGQTCGMSRGSHGSENAMG